MLGSTSKNATQLPEPDGPPTASTAAAAPAPPHLPGNPLWIKAKKNPNKPKSRVSGDAQKDFQPSGCPAPHLQTVLLPAAAGQIAAKAGAGIDCGDFRDPVRFPGSCAAPRAQPHRGCHRSATKPPLQQPARSRARGRADHRSRGRWAVLLLRQGGMPWAAGTRRDQDGHPGSGHHTAASRPAQCLAPLPGTVRRSPSPQRAHAPPEEQGCPW